VGLDAVQDLSSERNGIPAIFTVDTRFRAFADAIHKVLQFSRQLIGAAVLTIALGDFQMTPE
jgi:hypothetical protein